jgi:hypothetical protein
MVSVSLLLLQDIVLGKIHFLLVRIKIKHMELAIIRREASGEQSTVGSSNCTHYVLNATL